ncbi:interleukin 21 receptor, tandem duplicate 2 isoform X2 [Triplophysa rosa]|uniref:interleukin 21 receptor, tandem duplicate 2 isoform X2 n=1 Tax=Triplophysa rosa TaxID=992332 RepID=UPI0025461107|nr:interleukin 21 receptor, tandem duplicate 2 isoform X2 [Triplophysa rosa]
MIRTGILWIFWTFSLQSKADSHAFTIQHTCDTDYWHTITCSIQLPVTSSGNKNISYWLNLLNDENQIFTCPLQIEHEVYRCVLDRGDTFTDWENFTVKLYHSENSQNDSYLLDSSFIPAKSIKPNAPYNLTLQYINGIHHFSWENGYENHTYQKALLFIYNFLYYKDGHHGNTSVHPDNKTIEIDETRFEPESKYTAMVRTRIMESNTYNGKWSEWSVATKWTTKHRDKPNQSTIRQINGMIAVGTFVMLGLIILLLSVPAARMKIKEIVWVPTPATYFQPLYTHYQGNFQGWVLAKSPLQDVHVPEECSTIDKIAEVITMLQDQAGKSNVYPPEQCHTPYVGPSTELWAPCQTFDTCSETSIPCEDFSLFCEALPDEVDNLMQSLNTACFTEDELSLKASSLKSLESLGNGEPSEAPVIITPTSVCFKQDYCTLTDTPTGPVPTFTRDVELNGDLSND